MEVDTEITYKRRKIYLNQWGEYCVSHLWGGMVAYNAGFSSLDEAKEYIRRIVSRRDLRKQDFEEIAEEVKRVHKDILKQIES